MRVLLLCLLLSSACVLTGCLLLVAGHRAPGRPLLALGTAAELVLAGLLLRRWLRARRAAPGK